VLRLVTLECVRQALVSPAVGAHGSSSSHFATCLASLLATPRYLYLSIISRVLD
jgi:hypothetical protein